MSNFKSDRGIALVTAVFFSIICMGMAVGFLLQVPMDLAQTAQQANNLKASYIADAGIQDTMAWINHELSNSNEPCTTTDPVPVRSGSLDGWDWNCTVTPDSGTFPNGSTGLRIYELHAVVSQDGKDVYEITANVQGGQTFAKFSMFIDEDDPYLWDFGISQHTKIRGPVHKNRKIRFSVASSFYSGTYPETPFDGTVSTTESSHIWNSGDHPSLHTDGYDKVFAGGSADLEFGVPERPLPGDSSILENAAWGSATPATPPPGVTANPTGGIFIEGDVDHMEMSINGAGNFQVQINQGGQITTVTENTAGNTRLVQYPDGSSVTVSNVGNGVIFATSHIRSLKGQNKGERTIAVDFDNGKNIEISGSITRADTPVGSEPTVTDDRLGLVGEHVYVADESVLPRSLSTPLYVYATILATQRFEVKSATSGSPGAMAIYGGVSGRYTWRVRSAYADSSTAAGYGGVSGYGTPDLYYDKLLANDPPPEYPTTGGTELFVRTWNENPL